MFATKLLMKFTAEIQFLLFTKNKEYHRLLFFSVKSYLPKTYLTYFFDIDNVLNEIEL